MSPDLRFPMLWRGLRCGFLLSTLLVPAMPSLANTLNENRVKAGFIYNFIKYTAWPTSTLSDKELRVCSPVQRALSGELQQLQGRPAQGRVIEIEQAARPEHWKSCHVLFIPQDETKKLVTALESLAKLPVLTISDSTEFIEAGGMIALKETAGRIRFDINLESARRAGLTLSSQLLKLADKVTQ